MNEHIPFFVAPLERFLFVVLVVGFQLGGTMRVDNQRL